MPKLRNKGTVDAAKPAAGEFFLWDDQLPGFYLRVYPTGRKVYGVQYRSQGRTRRVSVGRHGPTTPDNAWRAARAILSRVDEGDDPATERDRERKAPTVRALADLYLERHARPKKKASSIESDERLFRLVLLPALGHLKVPAVTREDVAAMHHQHRATPVQANRALALAHKLFQLAERWGIRADTTNPCRHIDRYPEKPRERFLSPAELASLGEALAQLEREGNVHRSAILAVRLLILSGCRRSEILNLRWDEVDFERGVLALKDSKTGGKEVPLGAAALKLLADNQREEGNPFVCWGERPGARLIGIDKAWRAIRARAGMSDLRLHDLRHSFASVGAAGGESLLIVGKLLGHRQPATTARYAHLAPDPARAAADRISGAIAATMTGGGGAVVSLDQARRRRG